MKLIVECKPAHRLADFADVKLALLDLGYSLTITPVGDLLAHDPVPRMERPLDLIAIPKPRRKPIWPPRKLRSAP